MGAASVQVGGAGVIPEGPGKSQEVRRCTPVNGPVGKEGEGGSCDVCQSRRPRGTTRSTCYTHCSAHTYAACTTCQEVTCTNEDKMTSALSVGAHVQATRRPCGAGVLSPAVLEEGEL